MVAVVSIAAVFGVLLVLGVSVYGFLNGLRSEMINYETSLSNQYLSNQNYLSNFTSGFFEKMGVANLASDKMKEILVETMKGRYGDKGFSSQGAFFSAVKEAYPDIAHNMKLYAKIISHIESGRTGYRQIQDKLADMLRVYDKWRADGYIQSWIIAHVLNSPSENLKARIGTDVAVGPAALERMYTIVLTKGTKDAYKTGEMEPLTVPK